MSLLRISGAYATLSQKMMKGCNKIFAKIKIIVIHVVRKQERAWTSTVVMKIF
jgi:hypothetical protein